MTLVTAHCDNRHNLVTHQGLICIDG